MAKVDPLKIRDAESMASYMKKLEFACHNFVMQIPFVGSEAEQALAPQVLYWEIQAANHFVGRIMSKATAKRKEYEAFIARAEALNEGKK